MLNIAHKNPFPGMNPYLEQYWRDVHTRLMVYLADTLEPQLPTGLWASIEEQLAVVTDDEPQRHVQVVEAGGRVVTAVEVLSRRNKLPEDGRRAYHRKQRAYREGGTNLVEIDLVRDGAHIVLAPLARIQPILRGPCLVSIWRVAQPDLRFVWPLPLSQSLPRIAVPLRPEDRDAVVDLQELINLCYEHGLYHARIDYRLEPEPRLSATDAQWADALLRSLGLRGSGTAEE